VCGNLRASPRFCQWAAGSLAELFGVTLILGGQAPKHEQLRIGWQIFSSATCEPHSGAGRLGPMLRRIGMVLVLLLGLSVISPVVLACQSGAGIDCCAGSMPCDADAAAAICDAAAPSTVAIPDNARQGEVQWDHADAGNAWSFCKSVPLRYALIKPPRDLTGHRQPLYLCTGRLRL
jgi:hypothetical protein